MDCSLDSLIYRYSHSAKISSKRNGYFVGNVRVNGVKTMTHVIIIVAGYIILVHGVLHEQIISSGCELPLATPK